MESKGKSVGKSPGSASSEAALATASAKQTELRKLREELGAIDARIQAIESGTAAAGDVVAPPELRTAYQRTLAAHALGQATDLEVSASEKALRQAEDEAAAQSKEKKPTRERMVQTLEGLADLREGVAERIVAMEAAMPAYIQAVLDAEANRISALYIDAASQLRECFTQLLALNRLAALLPGARENRYYTSWIAAEMSIPLLNTPAFADHGYRNYPGALYNEDVELRGDVVASQVAAERAKFAEKGVIV
jgi:hypothetical protein